MGHRNVYVQTTYLKYVETKRNTKSLSSEYTLDNFNWLQNSVTFMGNKYLS